METGDKFDLGTIVVAPTCSYFADQGPVLSYVHDETAYDADPVDAAQRWAVLARLSNIESAP